MTETYELFALRYAYREAKRQDHFISEIPNPDGSMPMDYFVWIATNANRTVLIDTGFKPDVGIARGRVPFRTPSEAIRLLGHDPDRIEDVIITHMHYDHIGTLDAFPKARVHLQEEDMAFFTSRAHERMRGSIEVDDIVEMVKGSTRSA